MELDSLKDRSRVFRAPKIALRDSAGQSQGVNGLIDALKEADQQEYRSSRKALWLWIIGTALFLFTLVAALIPSGGAQLVPTLIFKAMAVILYGAVAVMTFMRIRKLLTIDYTEPVQTFLENAEKRFAFPGPLYITAVSLLALPISYATHFYIADVLARYFSINNATIAFVGTLGFFSAVFAFGWWATKGNWKKDKAPLLDEIRRMRRELEEEEKNSHL